MHGIVDLLALVRDVREEGDDGARERPMRTVNLALVPSAGGTPPRALGSFDLASGAAPELTATADGFALLAPARVCLAGASQGPCAGPLVPTFVRVDAASGVAQSEPVFVGSQEHDPAEMYESLTRRLPSARRCAVAARPSSGSSPG